MGHRKGDPRPEQRLQASPDEISRMVSSAYQRFKMPRCDMSDPDAVAARYDEYVQNCIDTGTKPDVAGMASAFGYGRVWLTKMKDGEVKSVPEEVVITLKRAWAMLEDLMNQYMTDGKIIPVVGIFLLKNNHQYRDQTETVVIKQDPYESGDPQEIARKYLSGMAPALDVPQENARTDAPIVETVVVDQSGTVE